MSLYFRRRRGFNAPVDPVLSSDAAFLSDEGTEGESGEREDREGSRGVSNSWKALYWDEKPR